jgi:RLL motif-containing protein 1
MSLLRKRAQILGYPAWERFGSDPRETKVTVETRRFVSFIEHRVIRFYPVASRELCNEHLDNDSWLILCHKYLSDMNCPFDPSNTSFDVQVQWLSGQAISFAFEDLPPTAIQTQQTNATTSTGKKHAAATETDQDQEKESLVAQETMVFDQELRSLATALKLGRLLPDTPLSDEERLLAIHTMEGLVGRLSAQNHPVPIDQFTSGLSTTSPRVDRAAIVIRMLHLENMRITQNQINCVLEQAQEFVSSPKTDASLGRVGR